MSEVILHISAGQGPKECQWVATKLANIFIREAVARGLKASLLEPVDGLAPSLLLAISGNDCDAFVTERIGSIKWIGESPFRPKHKRKNWFVGATKAPSVKDMGEFKDSDIAYETIRASGPGGQHVNKTDSAVRATHIPTGIVTVSQDQRSQFANKKIAKLKLVMIFEEKQILSQSQDKEDRWKQSLALERGNEVRTYEGVKFRLRK